MARGMETSILYFIRRLIIREQVRGINLVIGNHLEIQQESALVYKILPFLVICVLIGLFG